MPFIENLLLSLEIFLEDMQAGTKKHRYKNGAVQKPSSIFPPFQAREAQAFLSVPSRLFSLPSACHGFSLGKTARRELSFNVGYYINGLPACQIQRIRIDAEAITK
jgi:hypothetical protein